MSARQVANQFNGSYIANIIDSNTERHNEVREVSNSFYISTVRDAKGYEVHPLAERFEMLNDEEFAVLKASILTSGQMNPIIIDGEGKVIDGRNRLKAFLELRAEGKKPEASTPFAQVVLGLTDAEIAVVITDANINRRHLTPSDKLRIAKELRGEDSRTPKQKSQAKRKAKSREDGEEGVTPSQKREVSSPIEEKIALRQEVMDALDVGSTTASNHIKRACGALDMDIESGHQYTRTEADKVLDYLADNPKAPKPKPKPATIDVEVVVTTPLEMAFDAIDKALAEDADNLSVLIEYLEEK